jgi:hypothetical protein
MPLTYPAGLDIVIDSNDEEKTPASSGLQERLLSVSVPVPAAKQLPTPKPSPPGDCEELLSGMITLKKANTKAVVTSRLLRLLSFGLLGYFLYVMVRGLQQCNAEKAAVHETIEGIAAAFMLSTYISNGTTYFCNDFWLQRGVINISLAMEKEDTCNNLRQWNMPGNCNNFIDEYCYVWGTDWDEQQVLYVLAVVVIGTWIVLECFAHAVMKRQFLLCFQMNPEFFLSKENLVKFKKISQQHGEAIENPFERSEANKILQILQYIYKHKYAVRLAILSGGHPRLGRNSTLMTLFKDPAFDRQLITTLFSHIGEMPQTLAMKARWAFVSTKFAKRTGKKNPVHRFFKRLEKQSGPHNAKDAEEKILRNIYEFAGVAKKRL